MSYFYGEIKFTEDYSEFNSRIKNIVLKKFYLKKFIPLSVVKEDFYKSFKYKITLPICKEDIEEELLIKILEKLKTFLKSNNIKILKVDKLIEEYFADFNLVNGKYVFPFFISKIIKRCAKELAQKSKDMKVSIIWQDDLLDKAFINSLLMEVKNISVLVEEVDSFKFYDEFSNIYYETGLDIGVFKISENLLKEYDIIIATGNVEKYIYYFKKSCVFIDLGNNKNKIINRREDLLHINYIDFNIEEIFFQDFHLDAYLFINNLDYRNYRNGYMTNNIFSFFNNNYISLNSMKSKVFKE